MDSWKRVFRLPFGLQSWARRWRLCCKLLRGMWGKTKERDCGAEDFTFTNHKAFKSSQHIICNIWEDIYCGTCSGCPDDPVRARRPERRRDGSKSQHRFVTMLKHVLKLPVHSFHSESMRKSKQACFMSHSLAPDYPAGCTLRQAINLFHNFFFSSLHLHIQITDRFFILDIPR